MRNEVSASAMTDAVRNALDIYREQLKHDCPTMLPEHRNDKDAAAMLIADLITAFPAVENEWQDWSA